MIIKNKKYILKRIVFELFFLAFVTLGIILLFIKKRPIAGNYTFYLSYLGVFPPGIFFQSYVGYWPKLMLDTLLFNIKKDTFIVEKYEPASYAYDGKKTNHGELLLSRISDNKIMSFRAENVIGWQQGDTVEVKYYRLSKIILKCRLIKRASHN